MCVVVYGGVLKLTHKARPWRRTRRHCCTAYTQYSHHAPSLLSAAQAAQERWAASVLNGCNPQIVCRLGDTICRLRVLAKWAHVSRFNLQIIRFNLQIGTCRHIETTACASNLPTGFQSVSICRLRVKVCPICRLGSNL